ncbi:MAG: RNA polymerase sigma factor [Pyrinomonadaceae bacterium]
MTEPFRCLAVDDREVNNLRSVEESFPGRERAAARPAAPRAKWGLTKEAFDKLLGHMDPDADAAGEKYLLVRRNLVRFFEGRGCQFAEDHADETINRVARKLDGGEDIRDFDGYFYGVARLLLLEVFGERKKEQRAHREMPLRVVRGGEPAEEDETERRLDCLSRCLDKLPNEGRALIVGYYQGERRSKINNRQKLAESLGIPLQALRSRAVRLREKLESCVSGCLGRKRAAAT